MRTIALLMAAASPVTAQQASPYIPLDHWAMPFVEHLISAGTMADPTPLTRPLREADVVRALRAVDTVATSPALRSTVRLLMTPFERHAEGPLGRVDGHVGVAAATHSRRDPLREAGPEHGFVSGGLALQFLFGPAVAVTHPYFDTRLKYDPDWYGKKDRAIAGRNAEAYVSAQWRYGELFFGNLDRNWGPSGIQGIMLSDSPYSFDHLGVRLGTSGVQLHAIATQLDDRVDSTGAAHHRYMVQHRLWIRPRGRWTFALWEASIAAGVGRQLEPWYLNVVNLGVLAQVNSGTNVNSFVGFDFERRGSTTIFGQAMLDDIQIDRKVPSDLKPTSFAFTTGARGGLKHGAIAWTGYYTQVSNLAYRNEDNFQVPEFHSLGIGRNYSDYDLATLAVSVVPQPGILFRPELTYLRQGQGDLRLPHPSVSEYPSTQTLFQGTMERTLRAAVSGHGVLGSWLTGGFDVALHRIENFGHIRGASKTRFVGSIALTYRFHRERQLP